MIECMRLIIGEVGTREREREGLKIGRSERSRTIWAAVKGPQCWGRKWRLQLCCADTTHTSRGGGEKKPKNRVAQIAL
jgi:hypothetical protein